MKKIDPATKTAMRARRAQGARVEDVAREFGVSHGAASAACRGATSAPAGLTVMAPATPAPVEPDEPEHVTPAAPPTMAELAGVVGEQLRSIQRDLRKCKSAPERAALNRSYASTASILARMTPKDAAPGGVFVTAEEMKRSADRVRARWHHLVARMGEMVATAPKCATCGQHLQDQIKLSPGHKQAIEMQRAGEL